MAMTMVVRRQSQRSSVVGEGVGARRGSLPYPVSVSGPALHPLPVRPPRSRGPVPCPRSAPAEGYRFGRVERLALSVVVLAAVVVAAFSLLGASSGVGRQITVRPGDTALSIARAEFPAIDPARAVEIIESANGGGTLNLAPGSVLRIPSAR